MRTHTGQGHEQWHYTNRGSGVNVISAWQHTGGKNVRVAIIDTGFLPHKDLKANILPGYDFISHSLVENDADRGRDANAQDPGDWLTEDDLAWCRAGRTRNSSWHGTHVAGTVAALTNNALGVAGVAPQANIVPVRVLGKCGGLTSDIADGIRWAAGLSVPNVPPNPHPAQVLNLSLGGSGACNNTYQSAINDVVAKGVTVIVAAGNSNSNAANFRPANCDNVITVAATNRAGGRSYYSNIGTAVEIAAPGGETPGNRANGVLSTLNSGTTVPAQDSYAFYQGTSMATPHVAAVAALIYALNPGVTSPQVLKLLQQTASAFPLVSGRQCTPTLCGAGIVNAGAAVDTLRKQKFETSSLLDPSKVQDGWIGVDDDENTYPIHPESGQSEDWFAGNRGSGKPVAEFSETEEEYQRIRSLPMITPYKGMVGPSVIIGADDCRRVFNTTRYPESAQVLIVLPGGRCSGAMVGPDLVLTAGHCVHDGSWAKSATVYPGRNGRQAPFGSCQATRLYSVKGWTEKRNPAYDFGAIKLNCDVGRRSGWMGFFWQRASLVGKQATITSYPGDKPLEQWGHTDRVRSNSTKQTRYLTDTVGGNSGSGVFARQGVPSGCGGPCVHTAHAYGHSSGNSGTRITEPLFNNLIRWRNAPK